MDTFTLKQNSSCNPESERARLSGREMFGARERERDGGGEKTEREGAEGERGAHTMLQ